MLDKAESVFHSESCYGKIFLIAIVGVSITFVVVKYFRVWVGVGVG